MPLLNSAISIAICRAWHYRHTCICTCHSALKSWLDTIDHQKLTDIVEAAAQKEAAMGKDGAPHHLAELELLARAQKDWYYAMMSYIMGDDSDAEEESK